MNKDHSYVQVFYYIQNCPLKEFEVAHFVFHNKSQNQIVKGANESIALPCHYFDDPVSLKYTFQKLNPVKIELIASNEQQVDRFEFELSELVADRQNTLDCKSLTGTGASMNIIFETITSREIDSSSDIAAVQFLEYLHGGLNISVINFIDFTASNGMPDEQNSLHRISQDGTLNEYQKVIFSVNSILYYYDFDRLIQVYGFGAKPCFNNTLKPTSHFFPCSGDNINCSVVGVNGIYDVYNYALANVKLSGPTLFAPLLKESLMFAIESAKVNPYNYEVVLIMTDGVIHDMQATIDLLVEMSFTPVSVIIVGLGRENFSNMRKLDSDDKKLVSSKGKTAIRDIVQFVEFSKFENGPPERLAEEVLAELPRQVVNYMHTKNLKPIVLNTLEPHSQEKGNLKTSKTQDLDSAINFIPTTTTMKKPMGPFSLPQDPISRPEQKKGFGFDSMYN